jgi:hypothetical protein
VRLIGGIFGLITSLILFMGVNAINLLSQIEASVYIGESLVKFFQEWKFYFYGVIAVLFAAQQIYLRWPKPVSPADVEDIKGIVDVLLNATINAYYSIINAKGSQPPSSIRVNVMLPTWPRFMCGRRYIKIYYSHGGQAGIRYPDDEIDLRWKRGKGTCGYAWTKGHTAIYDSENEDFKAAEKRLMPAQRQVVGSLKSVLSIPIWSKERKKIIGVLNFDSKWNVDRTFFNDQDVIQHLEARSRLFSTLLFSDGVKSH